MPNDTPVFEQVPSINDEFLYLSAYFQSIMVGHTSNVRISRLFISGIARGVSVKRVPLASPQFRLTSGLRVDPDKPTSHPRRVWLGASVLLVVLATIGSILGASVVAHNDSQRSKESLVSSSMRIASTLKQAIQQQNSLVISAQAFVVANPNASNAQFQSWIATMHVAKRFPEVSGLGFVAIVPSGQLSQFVARMNAEPAQPLASGQSYQVTPPGNRPYYCLQALGYLNGGPSLPAGYDVCAGSGAALLKPALAGSQYLPYTTGKKHYLTVETPIYAAGVRPATSKNATPNALGIVGLTTLPSFDLGQALKGHPGTAVDFRYGTGSSKVTFAAGSTPAGSTSTSVSLHNGWDVQISAIVDGSSVFANPNALALLLAGFVLGLLLGALIYVLGTGRSRALALVDERTSELHHLALHDSLTALPNRALILDRIDQMLARSRREHTPVAVLFLDLDNFKDVNDTLGHAAGDQLLAGVAARLTNAIRQRGHRRASRG